MEQNDLKECFDALAAKQAAHTKRWRYYDGDHPISFVNPKMNEVIPNSVVFKKNWCQVVVNATRDRLTVQSWSPDDAADQLDELWKKVLKRAATRVHIATLVTGEAYIVAWPDKQNRPKAYYHDPRQAHVFYDEDDPDTPRLACKTWCAGKRSYLNLYYTDRIEHYVADIENPSSHAAYKPTEAGTESNPYGVIPVFHFRLDPRRCTGELTEGVLSLQDGMNKLLNDMMVASEYSSFPQRWGIGNWDGTSKLPVGPGTILKLPPGAPGDQPATLGTFETTNPQNYLQSIDSLGGSMAILSATPKHFFDGQGGAPSGEALNAMEAPLIAKVLLYQEILGAAWEQCMAFVAKLDGTAVDAEDIECIWAAPQTVQPQSQAQTWLTKTQAGIPIKNILRDEGWTDEQLAELDEDMKSSAHAAPATPTPAQPQRGTPQTREEAAPTFKAMAPATPDLAGQLASTGALSRAVNRMAAKAPANA